MKITEKILSPFPYLLVFFASLYHPIDSDLGWHLKYGEYFFKYHKILKENIFSADMPNYHWVNSSWLTDLITYFTFNNFGFLGLSIFGAGVITLTFFFFSKASRLDFYQKCLIFPILVFFISPINQVSFRGQLLSLLFLGIVFYLLKLWESSRSKLIFLTVPLFALWSNTHGQFLLGEAFMGMWIFFYLASQLFGREAVRIGKVLKNNLYLILAFVFSFISVTFNPFGFGVYFESLHHFANPLLKYVAEWLPFEELSGYWMSQVILGIMVSFSLLIIIFNSRLKESLGETGTFSVFFTFSFLVRRFAWPAFYLSMPLLSHLATFFKPDSKKGERLGGLFILIISFVILFLVNNPFRRINNMSWDSYCELSTGCSRGAMEFLTSNKIEGNFLNTYDWGGYIIWNWPQIKPLIDGRMHLWRDEVGYSAFSAYYDLEQNVKDINDSKYDIVLMAKSKNLYKRLQYLEKEGLWKKIYEDKTSGVFVRSTDSR